MTSTQDPAGHEPDQHGEGIDRRPQEVRGRASEHAADQTPDRNPDRTPGEPVVGVGPHPRPWPDDPRFDPELLEHGDRRNVVDDYRYWTLDAIVADLDTRRAPLRIAIQNWEHDFNIGSMVRTANAFNVAGVHIVGRRRWNRRGAMVTDRYLHVEHHPDVDDFVHRMTDLGQTIIGIDNLPGSVPLETADLPERACLVFGSEGPGLTEEMLAACERLVAITQYGSTRSINAGAAAAIAMYAWRQRHPGRGGALHP